MRCNNISSATPAQRAEIGSDADFKVIVGFEINNLHESGADNSLKMIEKCIAVLEKYKKISWCKEIEQLVDMFMRIIRIHFGRPLPYSIEELLINQFSKLAH